MFEFVIEVSEVDVGIFGEGDEAWGKVGDEVGSGSTSKISRSAPKAAELSKHKPRVTPRLQRFKPIFFFELSHQNRLGIRTDKLRK